MGGNYREGHSYSCHWVTPWMGRVSQKGMNVGEEWTESVWEIRVMKALLMSFSERKGRVKTWQGSGSDKAARLLLLACLDCHDKIP